MIKIAKKISQVFALATVSTLIGCGGAETKTDTSQYDSTQAVSDWQLVWSDEFDGSAIDTSNWTHEVNCTGGGNNERQCYTEDPSNSFVSDGTLKLVALLAEEGADQPYTSARIISKNKADFKYGRFEIKAKMPSGQGSFPAFWMLPTEDVYGGWPHSGEIDILETVNLKTVNEEGVVENNVHGTLHYGKSWPDNDYSGSAYSLPDGISPADDFHVYAIEWQEGEIRWYVDNYLYATQRKSEVKYNSNGEAIDLTHQGWFSEYYDATTGELTTHLDNSPFDQKFFMILNNAVGGDWAENSNDLGVDATAFTDGQTFEIDYIRAYQCMQNTDTGKGCATVRALYDTEASEEVPTGALILGKAPYPVVASSGSDITIYDDALDGNLSFNSYDPNGVISYSEVAEDGRGMVIQFDKTGADGNFYLEAQSHYDISGYGDNAELVFDMKVLSVDAGVELLVKVDSGWPDVSDVAITPTALGEWTEIRINLKTLLADENAYSPGDFADPTDIANLLVFDPTGLMSVTFDNIVILSGESSSGQVITLFDDDVTGDIFIESYNPDGVITATVVAEDGRGNVIEIVKTGANGNSYLNSAAAPFDISGYVSDAELVFDMFVVSADDGVELLIKLDSVWPKVSDVIVDTSTLGEWIEVRINLQTLLADENTYQAGSFADATNIVNPFVMDPTGVMTVKFDNIRFEEPSSEVEISLYEDDVTGDIIFDNYNPDSMITANVVAEDGRGNVIEVVKTGTNGNFFLNSSATPFDISGYGANSELVFDMFVVSADDGVDLLIKIDSGWPKVSDVIVDTSTLGVWIEVSINLQTLLADENTYQAGSFADATNILNPFVMDPTGVMTVKFDNIRYVNK